MNTLKLKMRRQVRRKKHTRKAISGNSERLRISVFKSLLHIYAQIIDDKEQRTLVSASTIDKEIKEKIAPGMKKTDKAKLVGQILAKRALEANIKNVVFDRNGFLYHGRVKAMADGAREGGLVF